MRRRAFTLIELLVVLAVIAVLAALLVATMQSIHAQGATTVCLSHLRQWGAALNLYANDHNGEYVRRGQGVQPLFQIDRPEDWFNVLPPYLGLPTFQDLIAQGHRITPGEQTVYTCPAAADPGSQYFLPYAMNMYLSPWSRPEPHHRQEIDNISQLAFLADAPGAYASTIPSTLPFSLIARHSGHANVCFVDGHAVSFAAAYVGCNQGEPIRSDIRWVTLTSGINQAPLP
jgi:prepilin-type N-terminal cleavage/methylation domain-containing protein/prepilin-type processing-associated H-X9-DG protein